jgi:HPt (histidine-containing phosphotransfer) domain-containing protein
MAQNVDPSRLGEFAQYDVQDMGVVEQLLSLDDGAFGLLEEMLALYKEDTPDRIKALEATLASNDLNDMADVAHAIKGAASTMGASRVRAIAAALEGAGRQGKWEHEPQTLLSLLKETFVESTVALDSYIAENKQD